MFGDVKTHMSLLTTSIIKLVSGRMCI